MFFHFSPYIFISPLLVPKPINACYFSPVCLSTEEIIELTNGEIKILLKIYCSTHQIKKKKNNKKIYVHLQQEYQRTHTLYFNIIIGNLNIKTKST